MTIVLDEHSTPEKFTSKHWLLYNTGDGKQLLTVTGIINLDIRTRVTGDWQQDILRFCVINPFQQYRNGQCLFFHAHHWTVLVTPCAISCEGIPNSMGWHIDQFGMSDNPAYTPFDGSLPKVEVKFALRNANLQGAINLYKLAYEINLLCSTSWAEPPT